MKKVGVTGGIGSGKTAVCRLLATLGAQVFYADAEAKRLMVEHPAVREEITAAFGPESYHADGSLHRAHLAAQVFGDEARVARINAIVHPRVYEAFVTAAQAAEVAGVPLMVKEAALIYETGGDAHLDAVVVVDAPREARLARVTARDGVTEAQVAARMAHQLPPEELRRRADFLLVNDGTLEDLRPQVEALFHRLTTDA